MIMPKWYKIVFKKSRLVQNYEMQLLAQAQLQIQISCFNKSNALIHFKHIYIYPWIYKAHLF